MTYSEHELEFTFAKTVKVSESLRLVSPVARVANRPEFFRIVRNFLMLLLSEKKLDDFSGQCNVRKKQSLLPFVVLLAVFAYSIQANSIIAFSKI